LTSAPKAIAIRKTASSPNVIVSAPDVLSSLKWFVIRLLANRPVSAKTSPWAKLISCRIP
jgi:hypothetical protein